MTKIFSLQEIKSCLKDTSPYIDAIKQAYIAYSTNAAYVANVVHLGGDNAPLLGGGDVCLKSGYILNDKHYVIKVAGGGFGSYGNNGLMLVFDQLSGKLKGILLDDGILTEIRTAAAGVLSAKCFAPKKITSIGIIGCGIQSEYHINMLRNIRDELECNKIIVYGRNMDKLKQFRQNIDTSGWNINITSNINDISQCNLIFCVTSSRKAILNEDIFDMEYFRKNGGLHFVCIGADSKGKKELSNDLVKNMDLIVVDSLNQCSNFGEIQDVFNELNKDNILEFGDILKNGKLFRNDINDGRITMFDSTGIATQDVVIAKMVYDILSRKSKL